MIPTSRFSDNRRVSLGRRALLACLLVGVVAAPAAAAPELPWLWPGRVTGEVVPYVVKKGDVIAWIAARHTVHPIRVYRPSAEALKGGLQYGRTLRVDQRRITPTFEPGTEGVVLNLPEAQVYYVRAGKLVRDYPVAVAQKDWEVPTGRTRVVAKQKDPTWHVPKRIQAEMAEAGREVKTRVLPGPDNPLGNRWIGFWDGTYGFHGTIVPTSIKHYASHGCVRFLKPDIEDLYERVGLGAPVTVLYQPVKLAVDRGTIWLEVYPDVYETKFDYPAAVRRLAQRAGVENKLQWDAVNQALTVRDGILQDVGRPLIKATPTPAPTPRATPTPLPTPLSTPVATPTPDAGTPLPEASGEIAPEEQ